MTFKGFTLDPRTFGITFIGRKASRHIGALFDGIGDERLIWCIKNNRLVTDYLPEANKYVLKAAASPYIGAFNMITNEDIYQWIPLECRKIIESVEGHEAWTFRQLNAIRDFLTAS